MNASFKGRLKAPQAPHQCYSRLMIMSIKKSHAEDILEQFLSVAKMDFTCYYNLAWPGRPCTIHFVSSAGQASVLGEKK